MRPVVAEANRPQKRGGLFQPAAPIAVDEHDPPAFHQDLSMARQRRQTAVVVPPHRLDRGDPGELRQGGLAVDVPGVQDQVDPGEHLEDPVGQTVHELGAVSVRHHPDPHHGHSLANGRDPNLRFGLDKLIDRSF